jgi:hypothetical protein
MLKRPTCTVPEPQRERHDDRSRQHYGFRHQHRLDVRPCRNTFAIATENPAHGTAITAIGVNCRRRDLPASRPTTPPDAGPARASPSSAATPAEAISTSSWYAIRQPAGCQQPQRVFNISAILARPSTCGPTRPWSGPPMRCRIIRTEIGRKPQFAGRVPSTPSAHRLRRTRISLFRRVQTMRGPVDADCQRLHTHARRCRIEVAVSGAARGEGKKR